MDMLPEIVTALDKELTNTPLGDFYAERKKLIKEGRFHGGELLQVQNNISGPCSGYAFHKGGRKELQFNVGFEDEGSFFRYGVAFSLERDRNLPNPVEVLAPKIKRFNEIIARFPELSNLKMWIHVNGPSQPKHVGAIEQKWVREGVFIFIGDRVRVSHTGVAWKSIKHVARVLNLLWPLYKAIEDGSFDVFPATGYKAVRLCWNTNYWHSPTGKKGKSTNRHTFEGKNGFGHEEWLFDRSTLIDGWKYGFIQAFNTKNWTHQGQRHGLLLFAIDGDTKQRYWVGVIDELEVLDQEDSERIGKSYKRLGWLKDMQLQVRALRLKDKSLIKTNYLANVRFLPDALRVFDSPIPFDTKDFAPNRYRLYDSPKHEAFIIKKGQTQGADEQTNRRMHATKATRYVSGGSYEVELVQTQWQKSLGKTLKEDIEGSHVNIERAVDGYRVDIVLTVGKREIFIELKTFGSVKQIIRAALSQLMEYAYWPDARRCQTLLIVGPSKAGLEENTYLAMLRDRFDLPVHYLSYQNGRIQGVSDWLKGLDR